MLCEATSTEASKKYCLGNKKSRFDTCLDSQNEFSFGLRLWTSLILCRLTDWAKQLAKANSIYIPVLDSMTIPSSAYPIFVRNIPR